MDPHHRIERVFPEQLGSSVFPSEEFWHTVSALTIGNVLGKVPGTLPRAEVKLCYDPGAVYLRFTVSEPCVRAVCREVNGRVWEDSCVEFFVAPDVRQPSRYFNLEINCLGVPLLHYNRVPRRDVDVLSPSAIGHIGLRASLEGREAEVEQEIPGPENWSVDVRFPISVLRAHVAISEPGPGVVWRGNFFKAAVGSGNPHYLTWSPVNVEIPDFHRPEFFGTLEFV
ncbi:MAG: carbohydrate-binding family 9-like protein [Bacteroidales bacterium]